MVTGQAPAMPDSMLTASRIWGDSKRRRISPLSTLSVTSLLLNRLNGLGLEGAQCVGYFCCT
jgi:hypothetical protein